jgi:hypothetical protein
VLLAPLLEEAAVAEGDVIGWAEPMLAAARSIHSAVAFQFGVVADGGFVDHAMAFAVVPLGAPLLIAEGGDEAEREKDIRENGAVGDFGFGFNAVLVTVFAGAVVGEALVGHASSGRHSCGCGESQCGRASGGRECRRERCSQSCAA